MRDKKIFVTNFADHDVTPAFIYTDLPKEIAQVNLTEGNVDIFNISRLIYTLKQKIRQSNEEDFLLLIGGIVINCIAFSLWLERHGMVNLLIYNAKEKRYILEKITHKQMLMDL